MEGVLGVVGGPAEITQFRHPHTDNNIFRFDISMDDPLLMDIS